MSRRAPRRLAEALGPLMAGLEPATTLATVQRLWADVVGVEVAAVARPVSERGGVLQIVCEDSVWAAELELMGPSLVARLNAAIGRELLSSLRPRADTSGRASSRRRFS